MEWATAVHSSQSSVGFAFFVSGPTVTIKSQIVETNYTK